MQHNPRPRRCEMALAIKYLLREVAMMQTANKIV